MTTPFIRISAGAAIFWPLLVFFDDGGVFPALLPSAVFHELGHILALRSFGGRVTGCELRLTGLVLDTAGALTRRQEACILLSGSIAGLLWCGLAVLLPCRFLQKSAVFGCVLNLFNLLPALPLDGGRLLFLFSPTVARLSTALFSLAFSVCAVLFHRPMLLLFAALFFKSHLP